jgi:LysM repeat protein
MVDPRDNIREDFIIDEGYDEEKTEDMHQEEYYRSSSDVFRKKSIMPFVIGGVGLVVLAIILVMTLSKPENVVDHEQLQALETRIQQLEKRLATIGVMDQTLERLGQQEQELDLLAKKLNRFEATVTTQIDQVIKELGALHQKIAQTPVSSGTQPPKNVEKKPPAASKKTVSATKFHQVQAGETLYGISHRYGLSVDQLRGYNNLAPNAAIHPGQKLKLSPNGKP